VIATQKFQEIGAMCRRVAPAFAGYVAAQIAFPPELLDPEIHERIESLRVEEGLFQVRRTQHR
jgi:hypothetical protein